jgi:hypothetical protein
MWKRLRNHLRLRHRNHLRLREMRHRHLVALAFLGSSLLWVLFLLNLLILGRVHWELLMSDEALSLSDARFVTKDKMAQIQLDLAEEPRAQEPSLEPFPNLTPT